MTYQPNRKNIVVRLYVTIWIFITAFSHAQTAHISGSVLDAATFAPEKNASIFVQDEQSAVQAYIKRALEVELSSEERNQLMKAFLFKAYTDSNGMYQIDVPVESNTVSYTVSAIKYGKTAAPSSVVLELANGAEITNVNFLMSPEVVPPPDLGPKGKMMGKIYNERGEAVDEALVVATETNSGAVYSSKILSYALDRDANEFLFKNMTAGVYTIIVSNTSNEGLCFEPKSVILQNDEVLTNIDFIALGRTTGMLMGRITDSDGMPMSGVLVSVRGNPLLELVADKSGAFSTDTNGYYRIKGISPGSYKVSFFNVDEDFPSEFVTLEAGQILSNYNFSSYGSGLSGTVYEEDNHTPVAGAKVEITADLSHLVSQSTLDAAGITTDDILAMAAECSADNLSTNSLAKLSALHIDQDEISSGLRYTTADSSGHYSIMHIHPGRYAVTAHKNGRRAEYQGVVQIETNRIVTNADLLFPAASP